MGTNFENKGAFAATVVVAASDSLKKRSANFVCDGTDDDVEIQAAIDAANGGSIAFSEGTFNISGTIELDRPIALRGQGMYETKIKRAVDGIDMVHMASHSVIVEDLAIDGAEQSGGGFYQWWGDPYYGVYLRNVFLTGFWGDWAGGGEAAVHLANCRQMVFDNIIINKGKSETLLYLEAATDVSIVNSILYGFYADVMPHLAEFLTCFNVNLTNCLIDTVGTGNRQGLYLHDGARNKIVSCHFIANGVCVYMENETYDKVSLCSEEATDTNFVQEAGTSNNNLITDNTLETPAPIVKVGVNTRVERNIGYVTENQGTTTMLNGNNNVVVAHGLAATPTVINVLGQHDEVSDLYVDTIGAANFAIHAPGNVTADRDIYWEAKVR